MFDFLRAGGEGPRTETGGVGDRVAEYCSSDEVVIVLYSSSKTSMVSSTK